MASRVRALAAARLARRQHHVAAGAREVVTTPPEWIAHASA
jgi:hypothetical protein